MLSARHPGLVPFLGAWSTQHFTMDKQELKALALLVINPCPCAYFAARLTSWESSCVIRILKKCFFSARKRSWHARSLEILWCDKPRRMGWNKSTVYPYHRKTSFKQRMQTKFLMILVPKVQWPNVASTRDCRCWHVTDGLGRCDISALSNRPLSTRHSPSALGEPLSLEPQQTFASFARKGTCTKGTSKHGDHVGLMVQQFWGRKPWKNLSSCPSLSRCRSAIRNYSRKWQTWCKTL